MGGDHLVRLHAEVVEAERTLRTGPRFTDYSTRTRTLVAITLLPHLDRVRLDDVILAVPLGI